MQQTSPSRVALYFVCMWWSPGWGSFSILADSVDGSHFSIGGLYKEEDLIVMTASPAMLPVSLVAALSFTVSSLYTH